MHLETQGDLFHSVYPSVHPSRKRRGSKERNRVRLGVARMGEKFGDEGEKSLYLYVGTMQSFIVGSQKGRRCTGDEADEAWEGNGNKFGIFFVTQT